MIVAIGRMHRKQVSRRAWFSGIGNMNDEPLSFGHGAPLRLRNETQLCFKQVKWLKGIEFVADFADVGGGHGGYNQDHEFFGYRQSI